MPITALNIVLTTTDSWVTTNVRQLYSDLVSRNHTVILAASLYNHQEGQLKEVVDGGDFNHLLPVHQTYYKNVYKINNGRGAKNVIKRRQFEPVNTIDFGQDPEDENIWYINDESLNILAKTIDVILPTYYPDFVADLIIVGPNEYLELHYQRSSPVTALINYGISKNITTLAFSTQDINHIYFQDESQFVNRGKFKHHSVARKSQFLNARINQVIDYLNCSDVKGVSVHFPNMNHRNKCLGIRPKFHQVDSTMVFEDLSVGKFELKDNKIVELSNGIIKRKQTQDGYTPAHSQTPFLPKYDTLSVLDECGISLELVDENTENIAKDQYDLEAEILAHPEPMFRRHKTWRRFFKIRYWRRMMRYYYYKYTK